jgi:hypothetical protein
VGVCSSRSFVHELVKKATPATTKMTNILKFTFFIAKAY